MALPSLESWTLQSSLLQWLSDAWKMLFKMFNPSFKVIFGRTKPARRYSIIPNWQMGLGWVGIWGNLEGGGTIRACYCTLY